MDIQVAFGETIEETFILTGAEFTDGDVLLLAIRHIGQPLLWKVLTPVWDETEQSYTATLSLTHSESELKLPVGQHKYGLTLYRQAVLEAGVPTSGDVEVLIPSAQFNVLEAEAREAGLS